MLVLPIQDPPPGIFSSKALVWTNDTAHIPWSRLHDFVDGEGRRDVAMETSFWIRSSKHDSGQNGLCLVRKVMWCSYGPQEVDTCLPVVPPMKGTHPTEGPGSRPRAVKKAFNNQTKRGCCCHFKVRQYKEAPDIVEIEYTHRSMSALPLYTFYCDIFHAWFQLCTFYTCCFSTHLEEWVAITHPKHNHIYILLLHAFGFNYIAQIGPV